MVELANLQTSISEVETSHRLNEAVLSCQFVEMAEAGQVLFIQRVVNVPGDIVTNHLGWELEFGSLVQYDLLAVLLTVHEGLLKRRRVRQPHRVANAPKS